MTRLAESAGLDADLEAAQVTLASAAAQVRSATPSVAQSKASRNQARVNLEHRHRVADRRHLGVPRLDTGQTWPEHAGADAVVLRRDLTRMHLNASIDESDVGQIAPGSRQLPGRRVSDETFAGQVAAGPLQPSCRRTSSPTRRSSTSRTRG